MIAAVLREGINLCRAPFFPLLLFLYPSIHPSICLPTYMSVCRLWYQVMSVLMTTVIICVFPHLPFTVNERTNYASLVPFASVNLGSNGQPSVISLKELEV
uniref:Uncharacterized protein n=1 Tax=Anguilla anguilla TaxID=7936 RepID=A0A0E9X664_ANGAN